ncbi:MAG: HAD-IC family P-type ATPase [Erythrobacter sp.]
MARTGPAHSDAHKWHAVDGEAALAKLKSGPAGLPDQEAQLRLGIYGRNALPDAQRVHPVIRFIQHFHNPLIYLLLAGALAAAVLGHLVDTVVILLVVIVNAVVGFIQEGKAEEALAAIKDMIAAQALVVRDGRRIKVAVSQLVPGDIVIIEAGDRVPADLRLLRARGLLIDEAALTGESVAAEKNEGIVAADAALGDRTNMAFSGTLVAAGQATGVVVATGLQTQIGRISQMLSEVDSLETPLLRQINQFARRFTGFVLVGAAALFAFAVLVRGFDWGEALIAVVALAVGLVPEDLPAVITITLAIGVRRMAARKAVIRKLPAVETLGATSVICSDKTGTLTRNEMTAHHVILADKRLVVSGAGYAPEGTIALEGGGDETAALAAAEPIIRCALLCNDASLHEEGGAWLVNGDPMEGALVALAIKAGMDPAATRAAWKRLDEIPFDAAHRFMASLHAAPDGSAVIFVKGAPEALFAMAPQPFDEALWNTHIEAAAAQGERVLAFGIKRLVHAPGRLTFDDVQESVELAGLIGFVDPPRPEALIAIADCRSAGIAVKMITGDHAATALAIARELKLADDPRVMTGAQLDSVPEADLPRIARDVAVFARTSPEHKLRIVRALQSDGSIVAMTGDGVNDAPSLKQADVGTAMGIKGTEAAKEASDVVLLDDNFATIVHAIEEGRTVYDNIRKVIAWTLPSNGAEIFAVVAAILVGFTLPMSATQVLWVNLLLSATLGLALAFEPTEPGIMQRRPRASNAALLSPFLLWRVAAVSLLLGGLSLALFFTALGRGDALEYARTMVVTMVVVGEIFYLFNVRYWSTGSLTLQGAFGTPVVLAAIAVVAVSQLAFVYAPFMNVAFGSAPLRLADGALIIALGAGLMILLEAEKQLLRRMGWFKELQT